MLHIRSYPPSLPGGGGGERALFSIGNSEEARHAVLTKGALNMLRVESIPDDKVKLIAV
jgi:hypothetical protein